MCDYTGIKNHEAVLKHYGSWPSFHDAELISILLDRDKGEGLYGPTATIKIHAFNMTDQVDERGYYIAADHAVITFYFTDIVEFELQYSFGNQNPISELYIEDIRSHQLENINYAVHIDTDLSAEIRFKCAGIEVKSVEGGIPDGSVYA
jgi:hypothetical protein